MNSELIRNSVYLLHIIKNELPIDFLLNLGLEYSQIYNLLDDLIEQKLIDFSEDGQMILTDLGSVKLENLANQLYPYLSSTLILPEEWQRIDKNRITDIYLPKRKTILKLEEES